MISRSMTAFLPVRRETNRLKDKNILPFGDSNLLTRKIKQLKMVSGIDKIVASSEDAEILEIAREAGAEIHVRDAKYSIRESPFANFVVYACNHLDGEYVLWTSVTTPFIDSGLYSKAIKVFYKKIEEGYDSLITVKKIHRYILDKNGSVNFRRGIKHKNSEDLHELFFYINGINIARREDMIKWKYPWGNIPFRLEIGKREAWEISNEFDYNIACLMEENK